MKSEDFIPLVQSEGHGATATTAKHAAQQADIVMLLVPWPAMETITRNLGDMGSKVMTDVPWPPVELGDDGYYAVSIDGSLH